MPEQFILPPRLLATEKPICRPHPVTPKEEVRDSMGSLAWSDMLGYWKNFKTKREKAFKLQFCGKNLLKTDRSFCHSQKGP